MMDGTLSANEAACVTVVPLKQVHRIIDADVLDGAASGERPRAVHRDWLLALKLAHETTDQLTLDGLRRLVRYLLYHPDAKAARERDLSVDVRAVKSELREGLSRLAKARNAVACADAVLSGTHCNKGNRIAVHDIVDILANGDDFGAILEAYPHNCWKCRSSWQPTMRGPIPGAAVAVGRRTGMTEPRGELNETTLDSLLATR